MSRGPSGATTVWTWDPNDGLNTGIWERLQNHETAASAAGTLITNWPNGSPTRTTLPAGSSWDGVGRAVRFELRNGDVAAGTGNRSEISGDGMSWRFREGDERWLQFRIKFDTNWTPGTEGRFNMFAQFHAGTGSPPLSLQVVDNGDMIIDDGGLSRDTHTAQTGGPLKSVIMPGSEWYAKRGQWIDINLHWKTSVSYDVGWAEVHVDGVLRVARHKRQTAASSITYLKLGMYRHPQPQTNVLWFDDLRLTSGAQVGGSDADPGTGGTAGAITVVDGATQVYEVDTATGPVTSFALPRPTTGGALVAGDLLVAQVSWDAATATPVSRTLPAGWSSLFGAPLIVGTAPSIVQTEVFYHVVTPAEVASPPTSWTLTTSTPWDAGIAVTRLRGVDSADPFAVASGNYATSISSSSTTKTSPSVNTDVANAMVLVGVALRSGSSTLTSVAGGFTQGPGTWGLGGRVAAMAYATKATVGATANAVWTHTNGVSGVGWTTALKPGVASTPPVSTAPTVEAGANASVAVGSTFTRTMSENNGGSPITSRSWTIVSSPDGTASGVLGSTATLTWAPTAAQVGTYVIRASASNANGTGTDDFTLRVDPAGAATIKHVQSMAAWTNWNTTPNVNELRTSLTSPATAGNFLVASWSVNSEAGKFVPPAGWTVMAERDAVGVATLICYKIAAGGEQEASASWPVASAQASMVLAEYSGVHTTNPLGPNDFPAFVDADLNTLTLDPAAAVVNGAALAFIAIGGAGGVGGFEPSAAGWTLLHSAYTTENPSSTGMALLHDLSVAGGEDINSTFSWTRAERRIGYITLLNAAGATIPDVEPPPPDEEEPPPPIGTSPILRSRQVGFPEVGLGRVAANVGSAVRCRLKVGTDPAVTSGITYGPYATPNAQGDVKMQVGLPATRTAKPYYYRVAMVNSQGGEWLDTASQVGILRTAPTGRVGLTFSFGSCINATDTASALAIANRADDVCAIQGDLWYADGSGTGIANYRSKLDAKLRAPNIGRMVAQIPFIYTPSDHDYGMVDDGIGSGAGGDSFNAVFREKISSPDLPGTRGVYWTRPWGTAIRFIVLDTRSFGVIGTTKLGATQKAWLKSTIDAATEDLIIIVQDGVWIGATDAGSDDWQGTLAERNEIGDYIAASGKHVVMIGGDMHAVAADNGTNSRGGFPVYMAAPLNNTSSIKGGPYSAGTYPTAAGSSVQQYGRIVVSLSDTTITSQFTGYSSDNTVRKTMTNSFSAAPPPPELSGRMVEIWDGSGLASRATERWTGSGLTPLIIE